MFYATAFDILQDYHTRERYDDEDEEKLRLLRAAADILKNDIKDINSDTSSPPPPPPTHAQVSYSCKF